jgi:hypothetical protein
MPEADPFISHMAPSKSVLPKGNVRKLTNGRQGGQPGHEGKTLVQTDSPDERTCLLKERGKYADNPGFRLIGCRKRQAFNTRTVSAVTEHVHKTYQDLRTGEAAPADPFTPGESAPVQYGLQIRTLALSLRDQRCLSCERAADLINCLTGCHMSPGTVANTVLEEENSPAMLLFLDGREGAPCRRLGSLRG